MSYWVDRPLYTLGMIYFLMLVLRAVLSWFPLQPGSTAAKSSHWLWVVTEPYLSRFRRIIPPIGVVDISFIVASLLVYVVSVYLLARLVI